MFGTVLNRMVIQAVLGHPLTVYGNGSQTRGLINLVDTVECIRISAENPAAAGEFRVFNQFTEQMSVRQIADTIAADYPGTCTIEEIDNPRVEADNHYYNAKHTALVDLGLVPTLLSDTLIDHLFEVVERHQRACRSGRDPADRPVARDRQRTGPEPSEHGGSRQGGAREGPRHRRVGLHRAPRRRVRCVPPVSRCA